MFGKIVNNRIVPPPNNDGNKFNVNLNTEWLEANGFHELTETEITASVRAKKLSKTVFDRMNILDALDTEDKTTLLTALASNAEFSAFWSASKNGVDLEHPVCVAALSALGWNEAKIKALKLKILGE